MNKKNQIKISLKPVVNKSNGQINFSLKKSILPLSMKMKLGKLDSINLKLKDFKFK